MTTASGSQAEGARGLQGKRILVVEDEYFIASDLKRAFQKAEAVVVGPVGDVGQALALVAEQAIDVAVLDVNLEGTNSYPIADRLSERAVPCLFLTGYDGWSLPEAYRDTPRLAKPFAMEAVLETVARLMNVPPHPAG